MSRHIKLVICAVLLVNLGGCIFVPGHRCCWRYDAAVVR